MIRKINADREPIGRPQPVHINALRLRAAMIARVVGKDHQLITEQLVDAPSHRQTGGSAARRAWHAQALRRNRKLISVKPIESEPTTWPGFLATIQA